MDVVTNYVYDYLNNNIYIKVLERFNLPNSASLWENFLNKWYMSLYGLRQ